MDAEDKKEVLQVMKRSKKLRCYYTKQLQNGWSEQQALMNTYDEWFYNEELYKPKSKEKTK